MQGREDGGKKMCLKLEEFEQRETREGCHYRDQGIPGWVWNAPGLGREGRGGERGKDLLQIAQGSMRGVWKRGGGKQSPGRDTYTLSKFSERTWLTHHTHSLTHKNIHETWDPHGPETLFLYSTALHILTFSCSCPNIRL